MFLEQHGQQDRLEGECMGGVRHGSQVLVGVGEQVVQRQLVAAPQARA